MAWEQFFHIHIADEEAEHIYTLQDATDRIARLKGVTDTGSLLRDDLLKRMTDVLALSVPLRAGSHVSLLPDPMNESAWKEVQKGLGLTVPRPAVPPDNSTFWKRLENKWNDNAPAYRWQELSVAHVVDTICLCSYKTQVDPMVLRDKHDVYIAVAGITLVATGADPYELGPEKSFTTDLGLD